MDDLARVLRRAHLLVLGICVGVTLLAIAIPRSAWVTQALDEVRAFDRANLRGWDAHAMQQIEEYRQQLEERIRAAGSQAQLSIQAVTGLNTAGAWSLGDPLGLHGLMLLVANGGLLVRGIDPGDDELESFFADARDSLVAREAPDLLLAVDLRYQPSDWGETPASYTLTIVPLDTASSPASFRSSGSFEGQETDLAHLGDWLSQTADGQRVASWIEDQRLPLGILHVFREIEFRSSTDAVRYLEERARPSSGVSVLGLGLGGATAGWIFATVTGLVLLYMTTHLRQLRGVSAEGQNQLRLVWVGFFPDWLSRALTITSLVLFPVIANGAYLFIEALTYGSMWAPWDPGYGRSSFNCCDTARVSVATVATVLLAIVSGYLAVTLRRVNAGFVEPEAESST